MIAKQEQTFAAFPYTSPINEEYRKAIGLDFSNSSHPLVPALAAAVPFKIHDLVLEGGPSDYQREQAIANGKIALEQADEMMYGKKNGTPAKLFAYLVEVIAVLAFEAGGITLFDTHYEAHLREAEQP